jgi:hypothetical protein
VQLETEFLVQLPRSRDARVLPKLDAATRGSVEHAIGFVHRFGYEDSTTERRNTNEQGRVTFAAAINWSVPRSYAVGLDGLEPSTSSLSGKRSNRAELQAPRSRVGKRRGGSETVSTSAR